jgi:hypothetical protein
MRFQQGTAIEEEPVRLTERRKCLVLVQPDNLRAGRRERGAMLDKAERGAATA